ncbi:hypothetical protein [Pseudomonas sp. B21-010]|uniref:hypothetical protein n=1 Tax=Pseudomonas sp. B21-010 TaxID=2895471 RepID=UPI00215FCCC1|nr:hypothetical protein [Pseudomonas sp. B21-010]UVM59095.1 hypothetical protein LOY50_16160 [Pseudomonas sp. B21-010]
MSFFDKHGCPADSKLKSHQIRHFMNTLAHEAGVDIEMITEWSARATIAQTRTYIHEDPNKRGAEIALSQFPEISETPQNPINEEQYLTLDKGPVHTTRFGVCNHVWALSPCQKHADCVNCSDLIMCKGHKRSIAEIKKERDFVAENFYAAEAKIQSGQSVATRWFEAHKVTLARLDKMLALMQDPQIEDGSVIQIKGKDYTHAQRILSHQREEPEVHLVSDVKLITPYSDAVIECLNILRDEKDA